MKIIALALILSATQLPAQTTPDAKSLTDAVKLRGDMADAVRNGSEKPEIALARLKKEQSPTGLKLDADADFAYAAIDIGRRLIATGKPAEAEKFFAEAEKSLDAVVKKTPDTSARDKAQYLQTRATIRANYLNKLAEGKADLDAAIALAPDDKRLQQLRKLLPADPAATLQKHQEAPVKG